MDAVDEALDLARRLPVAAVVAVFRRYGKPLESPPEAGGRAVELEGLRIRHLQVRTPIDVIANDWFVLEGEAEPLAMPGPLFAAAMATLSRHGQS